MALFTAANASGPPAAAPDPAVAAFLGGYSIEVQPRTATGIDDFTAVLAPGTRVYLAHVAGTPIADMVATAARLSREGFAVMPHIPARMIADEATLADWIARYQGEAGVDQALLLAGGLAKPAGRFDNSMQLLETGRFDAAGFRRLHVAGHPEGNRDIDPDGSDAGVAAALRWKAAFAERTDADMAIATQFVFDAAPVIAWAERLQAEDVGLPVHVGVAGPAKLQTLLKYAVACGVGPSLSVLQKRARDVAKLLVPFEPTEVVTALARHRAATPESAIAGAHFFPLGGIRACADWTVAQGAPAARAADAA